jgi:hypothetical protein
LRVARISAVLLSALVVAQYAYVVFETIGYRYQLEWMEGGVLDVVARVRAGEAIYVAPTIEYVPHVYPPLYFHAAALVSRVAGLDLLAGRLVSLGATLAIFAMLFVATRRATRSTALASASVALFVATYALTSRWFHLARVDMLFVALLLGGAIVLRDATWKRSGALAGVLFALAFFTKQPAALAAGPLLLFALADDVRRALSALAVLAVGAGSGVLLLSALTDGWFAYYAFDLPAQHDLAVGASLSYLGTRFWPFAPAFAAAAWVVVRRFVREAPHRGVDLGTFLGFTLSSVVSFAHTGAETNALLPMVVAVALLAPRVVARGHDSDPEPAPRRARWIAAVALLAFAIEIALLVEPARASLPSPGAEEQGDAFLAWVGAREGEVLLPDHRFLQTRVGKRSFGLGMAARDVLRAERGDRGRTLLEASLAHALEERRFSTVVLSQRDWLGGVVGMAYEPAPDLDLAPWPVSGYRTRPRYVWVRGPTEAALLRAENRGGP